MPKIQTFEEDSEKLDFAKHALILRIDSIGTWTEFKQMVASVSPIAMKNFIVNQLQSRAQSLRDSANAGNTVATNIDELIAEL